MFCMCIDTGCVGTGEIGFCSVSVLIDGALLQRKLSYVLMCIDRGCVGTEETEFCSVCVLIYGALLQRKVTYVLYVY